jgi:hypothetical protein
MHKGWKEVSKCCVDGCIIWNTWDGDALYRVHVRHVDTLLIVNSYTVIAVLNLDHQSP